MTRTDPREILSRPAPPPDFTVAYGDGPEHVADVRLPEGTIAGPVVIVIHGGFWMAEYDRAHVGPLATALASAGYPVATLEYRRVGHSGGGWPGTFDDVAAGVDAVPGLVAAHLGTGVAGPVLMGHSAGGQLALWAAHRSAARGTPVTGVVALAPVADLRRAYALGLGDDAVRALLGGSPADFASRYDAVDPALIVPIGVPTVVVHGDGDQQVPIELGRDWAASSRAAGDETSFVPLTGIEHFGLIDPQSMAWTSVLSGLASVCARRRG